MNFLLDELSTQLSFHVSFPIFHVILCSRFCFYSLCIFEKNAINVKIDGTLATYVETKDVFQNQLHAYTITHAIDDKNVFLIFIDEKLTGYPDYTFTSKLIIFNFHKKGK